MLAQKIIKRKKNSPWWNKSLCIERKRVRALRGRYQAESDDDLRNDLKLIYKKNRAKYKKLIIDTKRNSFKEFLESVTKSQTFGSGYKIIKDKFKTNTLNNNIRKGNDEYTENYMEAKKLIITNNFYDANIIEEDFDNTHSYNNTYDQDINFIELEAALHSINGNKAVDHDVITIDIVKYLYKLYPDFIYKLYNLIWVNGNIPDKCKIFRVCLIPKEGKNPTLWDSYTPFV